MEDLQYVGNCSREHVFFFFFPNGFYARGVYRLFAKDRMLGMRDFRMQLCFASIDILTCRMGLSSIGMGCWLGKLA